jgi:hypothetical protein
VNRCARRTARVTLAVASAVAGARCAGDVDANHVRREADATTSYDVQRAALDSVFNGRERARRLVLWESDAADGPALEPLRSTLPRARKSHTIDVARLAPSLPARTLTEAAVADLFRKNPDGWAAFFRENPGSPGLVELSPVWLSWDGDSATTHIGRSCGEHCRNAWRVFARRMGSRWTVTEIQWMRVPGA